MKIKEWIINRLEKDVESNGGHIELEALTEEERNKLFVEFGEGNPELTNFLRTAYNHNAPSMFCCSGHGYQSAYVVLKVNDENIELLKKVGKVLSKHGISTNFFDDYNKGLTVSYRLANNNNPSTQWLNIASQIMENPELFDDNYPTIYYHEEIIPSPKPFLFDLKMKLLNYLRGKNLETLPVRKQ